ncbi:high affinity Mn2+ porin [Cupriavidus metallidurans]|uniref:Carbohydrate porin n=2 Tax=Cupriavidus TaxID=106589 RepID=A0A3G8GVT8_9BURK|nr:MULTISPECIES: carbohydrate porin [Cupriavidus]AZG12204.1 carbohydrate porin [Cupriavidus pauculus]KAB0595816.1 carbohydrate porin [Cupriavidus pauculus]MDE4922483.1 carbohydrate porin [Cupriavidus metallidurans]QBP14299.1 carbohydrate porin [Cupriavidus metallidurans]UAL02619.1 carbohydrate porin [Cupriavidus pauculus]
MSLIFLQHFFASLHFLRTLLVSHGAFAPILLLTLVAVVPSTRLRAQVLENASGAAVPDENTPLENSERFAFHGQTTYVWQRKPAFDAAYSGENSLSQQRDKSYSWSVTLDLGVRPWRGAEFHFNPEAVQGVPFSGLRGLGGLSNGEGAKFSSTSPTVYRARAFLRQAWGLGGGEEVVEANFNQFAAQLDKRRLVLTAGNVPVLDIFNAVEYGQDPRTQFLNWSFLTHGSFDYPADARGYNWGVALEYIYDDWAVRVGRFLLPVESNGLALDARFMEHYGDMIELEKGYQFVGQPGKARLLLWRNKAKTGAFRDAIAIGSANGRTPDVADVRREHAKVGVGLSFEQQVGKDLGLFARVDWADDKTETYAFTEIGRSFSVGGILSGQRWGRPQDTLGIGVAVNMLGSAHRAYLAAGGLGAFLGDGALNYGQERVLEVFYSFQPTKRLWISPDFQYIQHPGYNRDRGPVTIYGVRLHAEF